VRRAEPEGWDLFDRGARRNRFGRASSARAAALRIDRLRRRRIRVMQHLLIAAAAVGLGALLIALRFEPNPAWIKGVALTERFDSVFAAVESGVPPEAIDEPGLDVALVSLPKGAAPVHMITGGAGGQCYGFYWNETRGPVARALVPGLACEPGPAITTSGHNVYHRQTPIASGHLPVGRNAFDWNDVLPDEQRVRPWVIPALILLGGFGVSMLVRASRVALDG
jgi:hypothetical protein